MADLPREFRTLKPDEIEDLLRIFKNSLASSRASPWEAFGRSCAHRIAWNCHSLIPFIV